MEDTKGGCTYGGHKRHGGRRLAAEGSCPPHERVTVTATPPRHSVSGLQEQCGTVRVRPLLALAACEGNAAYTSFFRDSRRVWIRDVFGFETCLDSRPKVPGPKHISNLDFAF